MKQKVTLIVAIAAGILAAVLTRTYLASKDAILAKMIQDFRDRHGVIEVLCYAEDVPGNVSIAEAMELTERFSDPEDKSFVNGILGTILREHEAQA